ncbi:adenylosuccinate lyase [Candidatus Poribacteria bacterium]|nr:adenylosuccinate lyase [Candidatus Poribacteria bacterium]
MELFEAVSPIDFRYYGWDKGFFKRLAPYASEGAFIKYQLKVELALVKTLAKWGICPKEIVPEVETACNEITPAEVYQEEEVTQHNVRALVNCIRHRISEPARPYIHLFATSADITDTAASLRLKALTQEVILPDLIQLERTLIDLARANAAVVQMGRTHGKHAEPITFGYSVAVYVSRMGNRMELIEKFSNELRGKFSGAVGAHNALSIAFPDNPTHFERDLLSKLGLKPTDTCVSTQIVEPEFVTDLTYAIESAFSVMANIADDIRHLHRTEIGEVQERYGQGQVGSSTMPHKENPKNFENVKSLWKEYMPRLVTVMMDGISEHQRDLTNSASSRYIPEIFIAFDYAVNRLAKALSRLNVDQERMRRTLLQGVKYTVAEPIYICLALNGFPDAYDYTRQLAKRWIDECEEMEKRGRHVEEKLTDLIRKDSVVAPYLKALTEEQKNALDSPETYIGDSVERTQATCDEWESRIDRVESRLATT